VVLPPEIKWFYHRLPQISGDFITGNQNRLTSGEQMGCAGARLREKRFAQLRPAPPKRAFLHAAECRARKTCDIIATNGP
jgi:hypothetical protein